ncbi:ABC transporter ATP-binding protein/permease [Oscillochloris sp. ZM17-4]|uniref:ABC transporter ATP-binding protein n=1 Tax=Oscillochloris sp. ZM17-4 TaxID=2866714 RepID=UPI001C7387FF|nr:ABC transporter ATP-binding protein [Oscillochloris sp. ZM17-4]MBX0327158.1 ABC transporter ATP-binding protein/permease [Oscillochloris sp. ZM17-4]
MSRGFEDDEILGKAYDGRLVRRLTVFVAPYWRRLAVAVALLLGAALTDLAPPLLVQRAIDGPISARQLDGLWPIFAIYAGVLVSNFALRYAHNYIINSVGQQVMQDMRTAIFRHIQRMSLSFFDRNPVGRLLTRITNDVDALNEFLTQGLVMILADMVTLVGIISVMLVLNWRLALISMATLPVLTLIVSIYQRHMRSTYRVVRQRLAKINAYLNEQIGGVLVTQLFTREARSQAHFAELSEDYLQANVRSVLIFALFIPAVGLMAAIGTAAVLYGGGQGVLAGWASLGMLAAFVQYTERAFQPIRNLAERYTILQAAMASAERIFGVLDTPEDVRDPETPAILPSPVRGAIEFRDVVFGYNPDEPVLKGISISIPAGQSVAIVGATGAGKSSTVGLLARFYDVQQGGIYLDGVDIRTVAQRELRRHVAAVPQDPVCFSGTIASNIRLHSAEISDERMRWAAELVNASVFIERMPGGYDHEIRERGSNLSIGQRQLIAFARALAFNPEVLLILDEATSSVDTATEALIQDALVKMLKGRTSIVIAHRLSTIRHVDRIIVLDHGRVVEDGSHEDLLALGGFYHRLYHLQFAEQAAT